MGRIDIDVPRRNYRNAYSCVFHTFFRAEHAIRRRHILLYFHSHYVFILRPYPLRLQTHSFIQHTNTSIRRLLGKVWQPFIQDQYQEIELKSLLYDCYYSSYPLSYHCLCDRSSVFLDSSIDSSEPYNDDVQR